MVMRYIFDIYTKHKRLWMDDFDFREKRTKNGKYYTAKVFDDERKAILKRLRWSGLKYRCIEEQWERSSDYRKKFFKEHEGEMFRCRYCNKKLSKDKVFVDHVVPIHAAKDSPRARRILKSQGIDNVNDVRNLVASCKHCNLLKGDKMGVWLIRAKLGKYSAYWVVKPIVQIAVVIGFIYYLYEMGALSDMYGFVSKFVGVL